MALGNQALSRRERVRAATRSEILDAAWAMARRDGLAALSLSALARHMGMQPPSLYTYFPSKNAIYDAMFAQAAREFLDVLRSIEHGDDPRAAIKVGARAFFDFCRADPARYQLLFQRTIPGFVPSATSYAFAVEAFELTAEQLRERGIDKPEHLDLLTALLTGLVNQQISNDPEGDRWERLVDDAIDMFVDHVSGERRRNPRRKPA